MLRRSFILTAVPGPDDARRGPGPSRRVLPRQSGYGGDRRDRNDCFTPTVLHIQPGQSVTWINRDKEAHTISGANIAWGDYRELAFGASVTHQFTTPGAYPYYCFLHDGMIRAVVVGDGNGPGAAASTGAVGAAASARAQPGTANARFHGCRLTWPPSSAHWREWPRDGRFGVAPERRAFQVKHLDRGTASV